MNKNQLLKIVNPVLFVAVFFQFAGIFITKFIVVFDWQYAVHEWMGYVIGLLVLLHIDLNWTWIKNTLFKKKSVAGK